MLSELDYQAKAQTLMEALPWMKEIYGKTIVVKYGGAAMRDPRIQRLVADDIIMMKIAGVHPVVVHGGGPEINSLMEKLGHEVKFIDGMRVTNSEAMEIVKMVLVGKVNKDIVNSINLHGDFAVGISGEDGGLFRGLPISEELGRAGKITSIHTEIVERLIEDDFIPVIATVGVGEDGESLNVNADLVAAKLSIALQADKCIYLTDVNGLYRDFSDKESLISVLGLSEGKEMLASKQIDEGMLPKLAACLEAVEGGVSRAHILNGTLEHSIIMELFTNSGIGTMIGRDEDV